MNRKQFLYSVAGASVAEAMTSPGTAERGPKPSLAVTILTTAIRMNAYMSPDLNMPTRCLKLSPSAPHFNVAIQNISAQPIRLWNEDNSLGFENLTLEVSAIGGKPLAEPIKVKRERDSWYSNNPTFSILNPGEMVMREVALQPLKERPADRKPWKWPYKGFPLAEMDAANSVRMRAVFEVGPEGVRMQDKVWIGRVTSPEHNFVLYITELD